MANFAGWTMRTIGPLLPENKIGRANLVAAFPEKSAAEIDTILRGVWDNLGRMGAEFAHLDRLWDFDPKQPDRRGRIELRPADIQRFIGLLNDGKPALIFAAHLGNWELPAIGAATYKLDSAVLYRKPNIAAIDRWLAETRAASMGTLIPTGLDAPMKIAEALQRGAHVGMLVDQYYVRGVEVTFFGRRTWPIRCWRGSHGISIARSTARASSACPATASAPELTEEIPAVRDAEGKIDIAGTMQASPTWSRAGSASIPSNGSGCTGAGGRRMRRRGADRRGEVRFRSEARPPSTR